MDFELLGDYYSRLERQGPGSPQTTLKALSFLDGKDKFQRVADIGCGTGAPTLLLAEHLQAHVTGLDFFPAFINRLNKQAVVSGLESRVRGIVGNMEELPFEKGSLDLIWSEGSIYNIGFERGINEWREYLKPGGYLVASEITWLTSARPAEINEYWEKAYPEIDLASAKLGQMEKAGYTPVASFTIPETCWTDYYYKPQVAIRAAFLEKYTDRQDALDFIKSEEAEAALYDQFKAYYGYVFYIGKKITDV